MDNIQKRRLLWYTINDHPIEEMIQKEKAKQDMISEELLEKVVQWLQAGGVSFNDLEDAWVKVEAEKYKPEKSSQPKRNS